MEFHFYFKQMASSETLKTLAQRKLADLIKRSASDSVQVHLTFFTERNSKKIHCHFYTRSGAMMNASSTSDNMQNSIDLLVLKLTTQLARHKVKTRRQLRLPLTENRALKLVRNASPFHIFPQDDDNSLEFETVSTLLAAH